MFYIDFETGYVSNVRENNRQTQISSRDDLIKWLFSENLICLAKENVYLYRKTVFESPNSVLRVQRNRSCCDFSCHIRSEMNVFLSHRLRALKNNISISSGLVNELRSLIADIDSVFDDAYRQVSNDFAVLCDDTVAVGRIDDKEEKEKGVQYKTDKKEEKEENAKTVKNANIVEMVINNSFIQTLPQIPVLRGITSLTITSPWRAQNFVDQFLQSAPTNLLNLRELSVKCVRKQQIFDAIADWIGMPGQRINKLALDYCSNCNERFSLTHFARVVQTVSLTHLKLTGFAWDEETFSSDIDLACETILRLETLNLISRHLLYSMQSVESLRKIVVESTSLKTILFPGFSYALYQADHLLKWRRALQRNVTLETMQFRCTETFGHDISEMVKRNTTFLRWKNVSNLIVEFCIAMATLCQCVQFPPYVLLDIFDWLPSPCFCTNVVAHARCRFEQTAIMHLLDPKRKIQRILRAQQSVRRICGK